MLLRRKAASQYLLNTFGLRYAPQTLSKYAIKGTGPTFYYVDMIPYYKTEDLNVWAVAKATAPNRRGRYPRKKMQRLNFLLTART